MDSKGNYEKRLAFGGRISSFRWGEGKELISNSFDSVKSWSWRVFCSWKNGEIEPETDLGKGFKFAARRVTLVVMQDTCGCFFNNWCASSPALIHCLKLLLDVTSSSGPGSPGSHAVLRAYRYASDMLVSWKTSMNKVIKWIESIENIWKSWEMIH